MSFYLFVTIPTFFLIRKTSATAHQKSHFTPFLIAEFGPQRILMSINPGQRHVIIGSIRHWFATGISHIGKTAQEKIFLRQKIMRVAFAILDNVFTKARQAKF